MQLDGALITIERRRTTECIDLAVVFVREHIAGVLLMTLAFAIPSCALSWWLVSESDGGLWLQIILFASVSPTLGAVLVIAAGRRVFGDSFRVADAFTKLRSRLGILLFYMLVVRLCSVLLACLIIVPLLLIVRYGFLAEVLFLENTPRKKVGARISNLMTGVYSDLVGRGLVVFAFNLLMLFGLFCLLEFFCSSVLGLPILSGRLSGGASVEDELPLLVLTDPRFNTAVHALLWLVYPLVRLAWFFCYLDVRIQKEGWDVELDFRIEAQRLAGAAT